MKWISAPDVLVSRLNRRLQIIRDALAIFVSVLLILLGWGQWTKEPVWYVIHGFCVAFIVLSVINILMLRRNVRSKAFYYGNSIYQLLPSLILGGLLPIVFIPLLILNISVIVTLRQKTPEQPGATVPMQPSSSATSKETPPSVQIP